MHDASHESHPHVNYFAIFIALCVCTALSVIFDVVHLTPTLLVVLVLAVAVAKAMFVMTYFMHLKFEGKWKFIILMPTAILAVGLMVALAPDMAMKYYPSTAPQQGYPKHQPGGHGDAHAAPAHGDAAHQPSGH